MAEQSARSLRDSESPTRDSPLSQTHQFPCERGWTPDRSLQVWRRGTLLTILRTEEMRRKLERTCFSRDRKQVPKTVRSTESKSESLTPRPQAQKSEEVFLHSNDGILAHLRELKRAEVKRRMALRDERGLEAKTARLDRESETEEQSFSRLLRINQKLHRSNESHKIFLKTRASSVAQKRKRPKVVETPAEESIRLEEYLSKTISEDQRISRVKETLSKSSEEIKRRREERHKKAESNLKIAESRLESRLKKVVERQEELCEVAELKLAEHARAHQLRQEQLREREEHTESLLDRLKHEQNMKASRLLGKMSDSFRRVEKLKKERASTVERHREDWRTRMIAKERHLAALETLAKSPTIGKAKRMLKALGSNSP